jgi:hypothetical protein
MKHLIPIVLIVILFACKKEYESPPRLTFSNEEKKWLVYQAGQELKFKNDRGDSLVYKVTSTEHSNYTPEYKDTSRNIVGYTESYLAKLESAADSMILYFYKEHRSFDDPNKLQLTIRWISMRGQIIKLAAIENNASFTHKTVNGLTYTTVTPTIPSNDMVAPFTHFDRAYYDQGAGFIEIIDMAGVSWKRVQ